MASAKASGARFVGPPFALYPAEVTAEFDVVICMPVAPGATASQGVSLEEIPGGTFATTLHKGAVLRVSAPPTARSRRGSSPTARSRSGPAARSTSTSRAHVPDDELLTEIDWPFV